MSKQQQQQKEQPKAPATSPIPDGRWFQLRKDSFSEARLLEVVVRSGVVVEQCEESVDLSRIQLGKLVRRIGESFGESLPTTEKKP